MSELQAHQERSLQTLNEGLAHFDNYSPVPSDDTPVYAFDGDLETFEFAATSGVLSVGDLRNILSIFRES